MNDELLLLYPGTLLYLQAIADTKVNLTYYPTKGKGNVGPYVPMSWATKAHAENKLKEQQRLKGVLK